MEAWTASGRRGISRRANRGGEMEPIYLDHAATTALRPEVREAMLSVWGEGLGNPSSVHRLGRASRSRLEEARERIASILGAKRTEIVFTGGGTEADNLAILGRWRAVGGAGEFGSVACSAIEHKAVLGAVRQAGREGASVVILGVDDRGEVDPSSVAEVLSTRPAVVSVMWGNNEVGTIQPVAEIAALCRAAGVAFHTDAVQAFGRTKVRVDEIECDLLSLSAHKIGGPTGIGALYVRTGVELDPLTFGGGQERGYRPGTENVAAAVGFAVAAELAERERTSEAERLTGLRRRLETGLLDRVPGLIINGQGAPRLPHVLSVSVPGVDPESLVLMLDLEGLAVSSGSACQSGAVEPSHVLVAMGRTGEEGTVRLSLGRTTTEREIVDAIERFVAVVDRARAHASA